MRKLSTACAMGVKQSAQLRNVINKHFTIICRLCSSDLSVQGDCSGSPLLAHNLYQNSSPSSNLHNTYRHLAQQNSPSVIGGLNLSASSSAVSALTPPTALSSSAPAHTITTLSNNPYNNNHLYQHHNATTSLSSSGHISKHNLSTGSGTSAAISHHHPTPIEGLTALSSLGSSTLQLSNSLCGGSSNSMSASELGMSHWLNDGSSSGEADEDFLGKIIFYFKFQQLKQKSRVPR